jgi:hypothetical protein
MNRMAKIGPNKAFQPADEAEAAVFETVKARGVLEVPYVTAMENIHNARGMYAIVPEPKPGQVTAPELEDMDRDTLLPMLLQLGVTPQRSMTKAQIIKSIRTKLALVQVAE